MAEKQKKGEAMYQGAIKDKNAIMTQLASKESEIGMFEIIPCPACYIFVCPHPSIDRCTPIFFSPFL